MAEEKKPGPIADVRVALSLLIPRGNRWAGAQVHDGFGDKPYITVQFAGREYSSPPPDYYYLTPECCETLKKEGFITGVLEPGHVSKYEFELSKKGSSQWEEWEKKDETDAHALLIPGEHGWSSIFRFRGQHFLRRGDSTTWKIGHVFSNPADKFFIVFLDEKRVEEVKPEECGLRG